MTDITETDRALSERLNPGMEATPGARHGQILPDTIEAVVGLAHGRRHVGRGRTLRDRCLAIMAAPAAQGGRTRSQLGAEVTCGPRAGLTREEVAEVIRRTALGGGLDLAPRMLAEEDGGDDAANP